MIETLYIGNMNTTLNSTVVLYCLRRKLRRLRNERADHLYRMIRINPAKVAAMDNVEDLDPVVFSFYDRNILRYEKLIDKIKESK